MALDFIVPGHGGIPASYVSIGVDEHRELMLAARREGRMPLILRASDYYGDATYSTDELDALVRELEALAVAEEMSASARNEIRGIVRLCRAGLALGRSVDALGDSRP